jgi:hypothetical protein
MSMEGRPLAYSRILLNAWVVAMVPMVPKKETRSMLDGNLSFFPTREIEEAALVTAQYIRKRGWCKCLHCVLYVCDNQRGFASHVFIALQGLTGVPVLMREHEELYAPPRPYGRVAPPY